MSNKYIHASKILMGSMVVGTTICLLCSCSQKVSETSESNNGYSQKTEVVRDGNSLKTTTVTTEPYSDNKSTDDVHISTSDGDAVRVKLPDDTVNDGRVRVNAPFVKMDSDDNTGSVHVRAPFLKLDKDGPGDKVRVRIPGIRINTDD